MPSVYDDLMTRMGGRDQSTLAMRRRAEERTALEEMLARSMVNKYDQNPVGLTDMDFGDAMSSLGKQAQISGDALLDEVNLPFTGRDYDDNDSMFTRARNQLDQQAKQKSAQDTNIYEEAKAADVIKGLLGL